jgi:hypothetical protein
LTLSSLSLSFWILFRFERAALAFRHHADLDTSYGFLPALGLFNIAGIGLTLVLAGSFRTGCRAHGGLLGESGYHSKHYLSSNSGKLGNVSEE